MRDSSRAAALAALLLAPALLSAPPPSQQPSYTYRGTIHAVEPHAGSLELVTGVGYALRLVQMRAVAATRVDSAGRALSLSALRPGDVVRADCRRTSFGLVADRIEKLGGAAPR